MNASHNLALVDFDGDTLYLVDRDGEPYVPVKPIAEALGIDWMNQYRKVTSRPAWGIVIMTIPTAGGRQDMLCMPLRKLPSYLYSIEPRKVSAAARSKVERYQAECDDALWAYWSQGQAVNPRGPAPRPFGCRRLLHPAWRRGGAMTEAKIKRGIAF